MSRKLSSFEEALIAETPHLRSYARALTRTAKSDTDDLIQDTLMRAIIKQKLFKGGDIRAWLLTIMHNLNVNRVRASVKRQMTDHEIPVIAIPATQDTVVELKECETELTKLPRDMQNVIKLFAVEDLNYTETAEILSIPIGTVRSRLSRGRDELRKRTGEIDRRTPHTNYPTERKRYALA